MDLRDPGARPDGGVAGPAGPTATWFDPSGDGPFAGVRGQVAAAVAVGGSLLLASIAAGEGPWGVLLAAALAIGILLGRAPEVVRFTRSRPGALLAAFALALSGLAVIVIWMVAGTGPPGGLVLLVAVGALGLDWSRVVRLRALVLFATVLVAISAFDESDGIRAWAVLWLVVAFGALALLEADRRAGLPQVEPLARASSGRARTDDVVATVLGALAIALLAAAVLSVPSCRSDPSGSRGAGRDVPGEAPGEWRPGEAGAPGQEGPASERRYVPDPDGGYLIPDDGTVDGAPGERIPAPEQLPEVAPGEEQVVVRPDGSAWRVEGGADGSTEVTVVEPDGTETTYRFRELPDGLTRIDRLDEQGRVERTWRYDPEGQVAQEGGPTGQDGPVGEPDPAQDEDQDAEDRSIPWRRILVAVVVLAALVALAAWAWRRWAPRRTVVPGAPPHWALRLASAIEREGAARGRARRPDESVVRYGRALTAAEVFDHRIDDVTSVVSAALFSGRDPGPEARARAEALFDEVVADHPAPSRKVRS